MSALDRDGMSEKCQEPTSAKCQSRQFCHSVDYLNGTGEQDGGRLRLQQLLPSLSNAFKFVVLG